VRRALILCTALLTSGSALGQSGTTSRPPMVLGCAEPQVEISAGGTDEGVRTIPCSSIPKGSVAKRRSSSSFVLVGPAGGGDGVWVRFEDLIVQECRGPRRMPQQCFQFGFAGRGASECRAVC
jgi:hypothetical protein